MARPPPLGLTGAQQEVAGKETAAARSRRLLTTSGLHLLKEESVLVEKLSGASKLNTPEVEFGGRSSEAGGEGTAQLAVRNQHHLAFPFRGCRRWLASGLQPTKKGTPSL